TDEVIITVLFVNNPPVLSAIDNQETNEDTDLVMTLSAEDVDGDELSFVAFSDYPDSVSVLLTGDQLTLTPSDNYFGTVHINVSVTDGEYTDSDFFALIVRPVNDAPLASDVSATTDEDVAVEIEYSGTDIDNDDATLVYEVVDAPTYGSVSNDIYTPDTNFNGEDSFTYRTYDGDLYSEAATVTITVTPVNDAPEFSHIGNQQVNEGEALSFTISATDVESDAISFSIESHNLPTDPILTDNSDGTAAFSWTSSLGDAGNYNVTFRASDGIDDSDESIII
ncbi:uncharacterized protein METZ01_LOCUS405284, partial [marine metagenome]